MASSNEGIGVMTALNYEPPVDEQAVDEVAPASVADAPPAPAAVADVPAVEDRPAAEKPAPRAVTKKEN